MRHANVIETALLHATTQLQAVSDVPKLEAALLLAYQLQKSREYLFAHSESALTEEASTQYLALLARRLQGEPLAYLIGKREFWSLNLQVSPAVLIPRPETELLVTVMLDYLHNKSAPTVLELGTGSGAIALALAVERKDANILATDCSEAALAVAKKNAALQNVTSIHFILSDWFIEVPNLLFDVIVSNPPYLSQADSIQFGEDLKYEPTLALYAGEDGLAALRVIVQQSRSFLKTGGMLVVEHGHDQRDAVRDLFLCCGFINMSTINDLNGLPRITNGEWKSDG